MTTYPFTFLNKIIFSKECKALFIIIPAIAELSRKALSKMSDVLWSIDARRDSTTDLLNKMKDHASELCSIPGIQFEFLVEGIKDKKLGSRKRQNIYLNI